MEDRLLTARLRALKNNLKFVTNGLTRSTWDLKPNRAELRMDPLWQGLEMRLVNPINRKYLGPIDAIEERLRQSSGSSQEEAEAAIRQAWQDYYKVQQESRVYLRECLEIIGALAIRNEDLDQRLMYIADQLIWQILVLSTDRQQYYLLVHALEDTVSRTYARIIRLRLTDWTVWDLPLAGHELGHAVTELKIRDDRLEEMEEDQIFIPFIQEQVNGLLADDAELRALAESGDEGIKEARRLAEGRLHEMLADTYATYTMGPAYACSAILLQLEPAGSTAVQPQPDVQRTEIILGVLEWMNQGHDLYTGVINKLNSAWQQTVARVPAATILTDQERSGWRSLGRRLATDIWRQSLRGTALYPHSSEHDGWLKATVLAASWQQEWEDDGRFTQPNSTPGKLRDIFNAAWKCRLDLVTDNLRERASFNAKLAEASQTLCHQLIELEPPTKVGIRDTAARASGQARESQD